MQLNLECLSCNINQAIKIMNILHIDRNKQEEIMSDVLTTLAKVDYSACNPEVMKDTWDCICKYTQNDNPYKDIKRQYNQQLMDIEKEVHSMILEAKDSFAMALKVAIVGNLIDFASKQEFSIEDIYHQLQHMEETDMVIDDSKALYKQLQSAKTVLYIGDNCGEIVLDKVFIEVLKDLFSIDVYYGVRGKPIVNDVTIEDAEMVGMATCATIISNGDGSLGTVLCKTSAEFKSVFDKADVVIAKGQGNYEGLRSVNNRHIFHLFMIKCEVVASCLGASQKGIVCFENHKEKL